MAPTARGATRARQLPGGYVFKQLQGDLEPGLGVVDAPLPDRVLVPLAQSFSAEIPAIVDQGETLAAGEIIARDDESVSTPVVSPVTGRIDRFLKLELPGIGGTASRTVTAAEITPDGRPNWRAVERTFGDPLNAPPEQLAEVLYLAGVTALGKKGIPTPFKSSPVEPDAVDTVVVSAVRSEPYSLPNDAILEPNFEAFVSGVRILQRVYGGAQAIVGLDERDEPLAAELESADGIEVQLVRPKHPAAYDEVITELVTGRMVPDGKAGLDVGVLVLDVQAVLAVRDACVDGKPLIDRIIALGGTGYEKPAIIRARIGAPAVRLVKDRVADEVLLVHNGALAGRPILDPDFPVTCDTWGLTALYEDTSRPFMGWMAPGFDFDSNSRAFASSYFPPKARRADTNLAGELRPCIQCGYCPEVCPRDLLPYQLDRLLHIEALDEAEQLRLFGCIDCGLCSYVCVSKIPLMTNIITGRRQVVEEHEKEMAELKRRQEEERARQEAEAARAAEAENDAGDDAKTDGGAA